MKINDIQYKGLTSLEVSKRIEEGKVNIVKDTITKSYKDIILSNTVTFFNIINISLLFLVLLVGSYKNSMFIFIITINTATGIYQEIKAKKTLDKLSILTTTKIDVLRNGELTNINVDELVLDDYMVLISGDQIPADAIVIEGQLEVNEALLTGESDGVVKLNEDSLYSGSFVTSGKALCKVIHVGEDNYMQQITKEAKKFKKHTSQLNKSLNQILKIISIIIVPSGILLFLKQFYISGHTFQSAIVSTVAAALGMIPEGLVLLTSVALTLSVLRLAKKKTLVQELYCIETLARVDVLCLDKTGTITEGKMRVEKVDALIQCDIPRIIGNLMYCLEDSNVTSMALKEHFPTDQSFQPHYVIPFSSERKYSGVSFVNEGSYYLGALQFLFPKGNKALETKCSEYAKQGYRILVLVHSKTIVDDESLPEELMPCALILISDVI
ncbi:MAG: HAD-IC family P-type ATPase, partial [Coprobacillaceae bacterium]